MAKSHLSYTPPIPLHSSQFKHLTASGKVQFKLFSLRHLSNVALTDSMKNTPKTHTSLAKNRVLGGKHSEPLVNQYVWKSPEMWCYCFLPFFFLRDQQFVYPELYPRGRFTVNTLFSMGRSDFTRKQGMCGYKRKFNLDTTQQIILICLQWLCVSIFMIWFILHFRRTWEYTQS